LDTSWGDHTTLFSVSIFSRPQHLAVYRDSALSAENVTCVGRREVYVLRMAELARVAIGLPRSFGIENEALIMASATPFCFYTT
jgi:hypothetical protein